MKIKNQFICGECARCHRHYTIDTSTNELDVRAEWDVPISIYHLCSDCATLIACKRFRCDCCGKLFVMMLVDYEQHEYLSGKEKILCPTCRNKNSISRLVHPTRTVTKSDYQSDDKTDDGYESIPSVLIGDSIGKVSPPSPTWSIHDHYNFMMEYDGIGDLSERNIFRKVVVAKKYGFTLINAEKYFWRHYLNDVLASEHVIDHFIVIQ